MEVEIKFRVRIPEVNGIAPNDEQIEEWLRYELNDNGNMKLSNPLSKEMVEPIFGTFEWEEVHN
jgi:hypothetical protein